jgi:hypothetical protein
LIWSAASSRESCTVFSLIAIVPDSEFKNPIFTELPEVSTQELADEPPGPDAPTRLPQPAETRPATINTATPLSRRFLIRRALIATPLRAGTVRSASPAGSGYGM